MVESVSFSELSEILRVAESKDSFYRFIKTTFTLNEDFFKLYKKQVDQFITNHNLRWKKKSNCRIKHFTSQYSEWLQQSFYLQNPSHSARPRKAFDDCSMRTKGQRIEELRQMTSAEEIKGAYIKNLREDINSELDAEIINGLGKLDVLSKRLILKIVQGHFFESAKYTLEEALALLIDLMLSKYQYDQLHSQSKQRHADIYPPYKDVFEAKNKCYPSSVKISKFGAEIGLQSLLDKTIEKLLTLCDHDGNEENLQATYKWGFDGASGQSIYKQVFQDDDEIFTDQSVVMASLIPLEIASPSKVLWRNEHPSSTRLCRPIQFHFVKEKKETNPKNVQAC